MTISQLINAVTIAEQRSINKAAGILYLSQPHLSKSLRSLEQELGYSVFMRKASGVHPTEKGILFLQYARNILNQYANMQHLSTESSVHILHISTSNFYLFQKAFLHTLEDYQDNSLLDIQFNTASLITIIEDVYQGRSMIGSTLLAEDSEQLVLSQLKNRHITYDKLLDIPVVITLRRDHPLIHGGTLDQEGLKNYPFVDYIGGSVLDSLPDYQKYITRSKIIHVSESTLRHMVVAQTNTFSIGCFLTDDILEMYNLASFPLNDQKYHIGVLYNTDNELSPECQSYIGHIRALTDKYFPPPEKTLPQP